MRDHYLSAAPPARASRAGGPANARPRRPAAAPELPCRAEPDLFFAEDPRDLQRAKELCGRCPVRAECLAGALQRREPWGVWGGEMLLRGAIIADKRPRGRPRKADVAA